MKLYVKTSTFTQRNASVLNHVSLILFLDSHLFFEKKPWANHKSRVVAIHLRRRVTLLCLILQSDSLPYFLLLFWCYTSQTTISFCCLVQKNNNFIYSNWGHVRTSYQLLRVNMFSNRKWRTLPQNAFASRGTRLALIISTTHANTYVHKRFACSYSGNMRRVFPPHQLILEQLKKTDVPFKWSCKVMRKNNRNKVKNKSRHEMLALKGQS